MVREAALLFLMGPGIYWACKIFALSLYHGSWLNYLYNSSFNNLRYEPRFPFVEQRQRCAIQPITWWIFVTCTWPLCLMHCAACIYVDVLACSETILTLCWTVLSCSLSFTIFCHIMLYWHPPPQKKKKQKIQALLHWCDDILGFGLVCLDSVTQRNHLADGKLIKLWFLTGGELAIFLTNLRTCPGVLQVKKAFYQILLIWQGGIKDWSFNLDPNCRNTGWWRGRPNLFEHF